MYLIKNKGILRLGYFIYYQYKNVIVGPPTFCPNFVAGISFSAASTPKFIFPTKIKPTMMQTPNVIFFPMTIAILL